MSDNITVVLTNLLHAGNSEAIPGSQSLHIPSKILSPNYHDKNRLIQILSKMISEQWKTSPGPLNADYNYIVINDDSWKNETGEALSVELCQTYGGVDVPKKEARFVVIFQFGDSRCEMQQRPVTADFSFASRVLRTVSPFERRDGQATREVSADPSLTGPRPQSAAPTSSAESISSKLLRGTSASAERPTALQPRLIPRILEKAGLSERIEKIEKAIEKRTAKPRRKPIASILMQNEEDLNNCFKRPKKLMEEAHDYYEYFMPPPESAPPEGHLEEEEKKGGDGEKGVEGKQEEKGGEKLEEGGGSGQVEAVTLISAESVKNNNETIEQPNTDDDVDSKSEISPQQIGVGISRLLEAKHRLLAEAQKPENQTTAAPISGGEKEEGKGVSQDDIPPINFYKEEAQPQKVEDGVQKREIPNEKDFLSDSALGKIPAGSASATSVNVALSSTELSPMNVPTSLQLQQDTSTATTEKTGEGKTGEKSSVSVTTTPEKIPAEKQPEASIVTPTPKQPTPSLSPCYVGKRNPEFDLAQCLPETTEFFHQIRHSLISSPEHPRRPGSAMAYAMECRQDIHRSVLSYIPQKMQGTYARGAWASASKYQKQSSIPEQAIEQQAVPAVAENSPSSNSAPLLLRTTSGLGESRGSAYDSAFGRPQSTASKVPVLRPRKLRPLSELSITGISMGSNADVLQTRGEAPAFLAELTISPQWFGSEVAHADNQSAVLNEVQRITYVPRSGSVDLDIIISKEEYVFAVFCTDKLCGLKAFHSLLRAVHEKESTLLLGTKIISSLDRNKMLKESPRKICCGDEFIELDDELAKELEKQKQKQQKQKPKKKDGSKFWMQMNDEHEEEDIDMDELLHHDPTESHAKGKQKKGGGKQGATSLWGGNEKGGGKKKGAGSRWVEGETADVDAVINVEVNDADMAQFMSNAKKKKNATGLTPGRGGAHDGESGHTPRPEKDEGNHSEGEEEHTDTAPHLTAAASGRQKFRHAVMKKIIPAAHFTAEAQAQARRNVQWSSWKQSRTRITKHVVLITISTFEDPLIAPCPNIVYDARKVKEAFERFGFVVDELDCESKQDHLLPTMKNIHRVLQHISTQINEKNTPFIVYVLTRGAVGCLTGMPLKSKIALAHESRLKKLNLRNALTLDHLSEFEDSFGNPPLIIFDTYPLSQVSFAADNPGVGFALMHGRTNSPGGEFSCVYPKHTGGLFTYYFLRGMAGFAVSGSIKADSVITPWSLCSYIAPRLTRRSCTVSANTNTVGVPLGFPSFPISDTPLSVVIGQDNSSSVKQQMKAAEKQEVVRVNIKLHVRLGNDVKPVSYTNNSRVWWGYLMRSFKKILGHDEANKQAGGHKVTPTTLNTSFAPNALLSPTLKSPVGNFSFSPGQYNLTPTQTSLVTPMKSPLGESASLSATLRSLPTGRIANMMALALPHATELRRIYCFENWSTIFVAFKDLTDIIDNDAKYHMLCMELTKLLTHCKTQYWRPEEKMPRDLGFETMLSNNEVLLKTTGKSIFDFLHHQLLTVPVHQRIVRKPVAVMQELCFSLQCTARDARKIVRISRMQSIIALGTFVHCEVDPHPEETHSKVTFIQAHIRGFLQFRRFRARMSVIKDEEFDRAFYEKQRLDHLIELHQTYQVEQREAMVLAEKNNRRDLRWCENDDRLDIIQWISKIMWERETDERRFIALQENLSRVSYAEYFWRNTLVIRWSFMFKHLAALQRINHNAVWGCFYLELKAFEEMLVIRNYFRRWCLFNLVVEAPSPPSTAYTTQWLESFAKKEKLEYMRFTPEEDAFALAPPQWQAHQSPARTFSPFRIAIPTGEISPAAISPREGFTTLSSPQNSKFGKQHGERKKGGHHDKLHPFGSATPVIKLSSDLSKSAASSTPSVTLATPQYIQSTSMELPNFVVIPSKMPPKSPRRSQKGGGQ